MSFADASRCWGMRRWLRFRRNSWTAKVSAFSTISTRFSGFKQPIDDAEWTITTLTHTVSPDNGFTTSIELEVKIDDLEME